MRRAAKVDANQGEIVRALLAVGCSVQSLAALGCGVPDLLVWSPRRGLLLVEVKNPKKHSAPVRQNPERALTADQVRFRAAWRGPIAIVWDVAEALRLVGVEVTNGSAARVPLAWLHVRRHRSDRRSRRGHGRDAAEDELTIAGLRAEIESLTRERDSVSAALDEQGAPSIEHFATTRGPEYGTLIERVRWFGEAMGARDAEIEHLRARPRRHPADGAEAMTTASAVHGMPACGCVVTFVCRRCQREICACAGADDAALDLCDECAAAERQRRGDIDGR